MMRLFTRVACAGLLASMVCLPAEASGVYSLTAIFDQPNATATVLGLNDDGEVVGAYDTSTGPHAFTWKNGTFTDVSALIDPSTPYTEADGINNHGDLVGIYLNTSFRGYLLRDGQLTDIHVLPDESNVFSWRVNNVEQVIGEAYDAQNQAHEYLWDDGNVTFLNPLPGGDLARLSGLNDRGIVVGDSDTANGRRAVLWRNSNAVDLGVLPGTMESVAKDINNRNHVVGLSYTGGTSTAFIWRHGAMSALPGVGGSGYASGAASINDHDVVVGGTGSPFTIATVWVKGKARDLNTLVRSDDPLKPYVNLVSALQINNGGDIVALGRDSRHPNILINYYLKRAH